MTDHHSNASRRQFVRLATGTGMVLGLGGSAGGASQGSSIELGGRREGWVGRAPADIESETNPTLRLEPGRTYTVTWENVDDRPHNFVVEDGQGTPVVQSDIVETAGRTQTVEFEATAAMSAYYCAVHPESMRGEIVTGDGADDDTATEDEQTFSRVFATDLLTGRNQVPPVETSGEGAAVFGLTADGTELRYVLLVTNLADVTMAHVHHGGADETGEVVAWLFGGRDESGAFVRPVEGGVVADGVLAQGTITEKSLVGPLADASLDDLLSKLADEQAYVNVHTTTDPEGAIRSQVGETQTAEVALTQRTAVTATPGQRLGLRSQGNVTVGPGGAIEEMDDGADHREREEREGEVEITYEGTVAPGETVTLTVTVDGDPLPGADVTVEDGDGDERRVGQTDQHGRIDVTVPESGELDVEVRRGELEGELEVETEDY